MAHSDCGKKLWGATSAVIQIPRERVRSVLSPPDPQVCFFMSPSAGRRWHSGYIRHIVRGADAHRWSLCPQGRGFAFRPARHCFGVAAGTKTSAEKFPCAAGAIAGMWPSSTCTGAGFLVVWSLGSQGFCVSSGLASWCRASTHPYVLRSNVIS